MQQLNKDSSNKKGSTLDAKSLIIGILGALLLIAVIAIIVFAVKGSGKGDNANTNSNTVSENNSSSDGVEPDIEFKEVEMSKDDIKLAREALLAQMNDIVNKNGYIQVNTTGVDGEFDLYIYNSKGEVFSQGNATEYMTVFRSDKMAISYTDVIRTREDIDIMSLAINCVTAVGQSDDVEMFKIEADEVPDSLAGYDEYVVYLNSWDALKMIYTPVSEEFAEQMVASIKESMGEEWEPCFKFYYTVDEMGGFSIDCCLIDTDDVEYINWQVNGYLLVNDWELSEDWYTYDFSDAEVSENMLVELVSQLEEMMREYAAENNIDLESEIENTDSEYNDSENLQETTEVIEGTLDITDENSVIMNDDGTHTHADGTVHTNGEDETAEESTDVESTEEDSSETTE